METTVVWLVVTFSGPNSKGCAPHGRTMLHCNRRREGEEQDWRAMFSMLKCDDTSMSKKRMNDRCAHGLQLSSRHKSNRRLHLPRAELPGHRVRRRLEDCSGHSPQHSFLRLVSQSTQMSEACFECLHASMSTVHCKKKETDFPRRTRKGVATHGNCDWLNILRGRQRSTNATLSRK